jgi:predicted DNA-binding protein YlxM (UPF0122 family)
MGCSPNSNAFYQELHSLEEIAEFLKSKKAAWLKNINGAVASLVI